MKIPKMHGGKKIAGCKETDIETTRWMGTEKMALLKEIGGTDAFDVGESAALTIIFRRSFLHLVTWQSKGATQGVNYQREEKKCNDSHNCSHLSKPSCLSCRTGHFPVTK